MNTEQCREGGIHGPGNCLRLREGIGKWPVPVWDFGKYILFFEALNVPLS